MTALPPENRLKVFKNFVLRLSDLSKCQERNVAAIITDKSLSQVYSIGINGGPKGLDDCLCVLPNFDGHHGCIHAEINALIKCRSDAQDKIMICSLEPCPTCATAIINSPGSFYALYYIESWKQHQGLELLEEAGIRIFQI